MLGAGALLDIGIYPLTCAAMILDRQMQATPPKRTEEPEVVSSMSFSNGVDELTSVILNYRALDAQAICTGSYRFRSASEFCHIEGSDGSVSIGGVAGSKPQFFMIRKKGEHEERRESHTKGWGFWYEQDAIGEDLLAKRKESSIIPLQEIMRIMVLLDKIRAANGL
ncbi:D-xylose 1-dehydrogenase (NADP(+)) [Penicillium atrosanguineum]|uniref:D-xylose 1-dehydrogenase (NADP(+)) n=1 Tax=Penicillium atrosanguineum TaxID=1132637 RepID=A0A9W9GFY9_9EURO|nr:uncharacterized protein N7443_007640 [Penicillium atrosanguineum]KAJ5118708.1 D-xylose 1-dehydrogenase (NADP(+)) [Penicillium atrosanguineum]KAJ5119747.1 D-xylose 1-dehydrogenase (NADP(+)) [Penicillium atrosanguineum]KAJ5296747.1 hypothetical protein N7443_007640 [Penicillium atrosanguineum]KAJ5299507.1 D-xylose 1-dehydrogenase (NADP(+)) [Penicillium atrosanguineum]